MNQTYTFLNTKSLNIPSLDPLLSSLIHFKGLISDILAKYLAKRAAIKHLQKVMSGNMKQLIASSLINY